MGRLKLSEEEKRRRKNERKRERDRKKKKEEEEREKGKEEQEARKKKKAAGKNAHRCSDCDTQKDVATDEATGFNHCPPCAQRRQNGGKLTKEEDILRDASNSTHMVGCLTSPSKGQFPETLPLPF